MTENGWILPNPELISGMFFRKPGLPILMVRMPDGEEVPYWNTFYQEVIYSHIDEQELVQEYGIQYELAKILAAQANAAIDAGSKPSELELGRWNEYRAKFPPVWKKASVSRPDGSEHSVSSRLGILRTGIGKAGCLRRQNRAFGRLCLAPKQLENAIFSTSRALGSCSAGWLGWLAPTASRSCRRFTRDMRKRPTKK